MSAPKLTDTVPTWTTRDGRTMKLPDIPDDHLRRIIRMLQRKAIYRCMGMAWGQILRQAPEIKTKEDEDQLVTTFRDTLWEKVQTTLNEHPQYPHLLAEAERRNLSLTATYKPKEVN